MMLRVAGLTLLVAVSVTLAGCGGSTTSTNTGPANKQSKQADLKSWETKASTMSNNDAAIEYTKIAWEYYNRKSLTMASKKLGIAKEKFSALQMESNVSPATTVTVLAVLAPAVFEIESKSGGRKMLTEAVTAAGQLPDDKPEAKAKALMTLAVAQHKLKQADEAAKTTKQAEELAKKVEQPLGQALALASLAEGFEQMKKADETSRVLAAAKEVANGIEEAGDRVDALSAVAALEVELKLNDAANATYKQAQDAAASIEDPLKQAYSYVAIGESMVRAGLKSKAFGMGKLAEGASDKVEDGSLRKPLNEKISRLFVQCQ